MARIIHHTTAHDCLAEITRDIGDTACFYGSVAECSCGRQFIKREHQFDGPYWAQHTPAPASDRSTT